MRQQNSVASTWPPGAADAGQFAGGPPPVGEHGDRLGDDHVEGIVVEWERADVARPDRDPACQLGGADVGLGSLEHDRRDVNRGDPRAEAAGDLDRGGRHPAADVDYPARGRDPGAGEQRLRGRPPRWMTVFPMTAMNLYGSRAATSVAVSFVIAPPPS